MDCMKQAKEYDDTSTEKYKNNGKADTLYLMVMKKWITNIFSWSQYISGSAIPYFAKKIGQVLKRTNHNSDTLSAGQYYIYP